MAEKLENMTEIEKGEKRRRIFLRGFLTSVMAGLIYAAGVAAYSLAFNISYPEEYIRLHNKKTELVSKVNDWQRFIPLMGEKFAIQYGDSLQSAIEEINKINPKMAEIKSRDDKMADKSKYSWLAFFIN